MTTATRARLILLALIVPSLAFLGVRFFSEFQASAKAKTEAAAYRKPVVDEDPEIAKLPMSKVLDLNYADDNSYKVFDDVIQSRLRHRQFKDLDQFAAELRQSKATFTGGRWRLTRFYEQLTSPSAGTEISDEEWGAHLKLFSDWMTSFPDSITAPVAYADALSDYAWLARGEGWSRDVKDSQWQLFNDRIRLAHAVLNKASERSDRCSYFYSSMLRIALAEGWDREQYDALFDEAIAYEPGNPGYYAAKANYLLPRWFGEEGDSQKFLVDATDRIAGPDGPATFFYAFAFASAMSNDFDNEHNDFATILKPLWSRVSRGFWEMKKLHGVNREQMNRYAKWAQLMNDREEARKAFDLMSGLWYQPVWPNQNDFQKAKAWAYNLPNSNR